MPAPPVRQLAGRGWSISFQRWRSSPQAGLSSNLGASPFVVAGRGQGVREVIVRLAQEERLWLAVEASPQAAVTATLTDGRVIEADRLGPADGDTLLRRFARLKGATMEGLGPEALPVAIRLTGLTAGLRLEVSPRPRLRLTASFLAAPAFDEAFGGSPSPDGPAVYAGWRLP